MSAPLLVLDPGHGGSQPAGASSPNRGSGAGGLLEKEVALDVARRTRDRLTRDHVVVLTRDSDTNLSLAERADTARKLRAAAFVSLHFSGSDPLLDRTDVVVARAASPASRALADNVLRRLGATTGSAGVVQQADLGQLAAERHDPVTAACLVEIASLAAPSRAALLADPAYRDQLADALAIAIRESVAGASAPMATPQWVGAQGYARSAAIFEPPPPSDYSPGSLIASAAAWAAWFVHRAAWEFSVPDSVVTSFPHAAICQLLMSDAAGNSFWGTGFYIADEVLLSCGHNFYEGASYEATSVQVMPAFSPRMSTLPTKTFAITGKDLVHPKWAATQDPGYDLSVLPVPGLRSTAGNFSLANQSLGPDAPIVVCGYGKTGKTAAEQQSEGQRMDGAHIAEADVDLIHYPMLTVGGHSGSPVFSGRMVVGVHTGATPSKQLNRAVLLTPDKEDWITSKAGTGVEFGQGLGRWGSALTDASSTQTEQSDQVRLDIARSVGFAEASGIYAKVHHDSQRLNFGIGSWTLTRIADALDTIEGYATANGLTSDLVTPFGGQAGFDTVRAACRTGALEPLTAGQEAQLLAMSRVASLHPGQDLHLAKDIKADLTWLGSYGTNPALPWYPFIDGGMGAISEIAAHVLVHALHQSGRGLPDGSNGLPKRMKEVIAGFGGEAKMGTDMVSGALTERMWLEALAARIVAVTVPAVAARYSKLFADWGSSDLSYYFSPST